MKMKYILAISVLVLFSVSTHASKVKEGKNGIYFQKASGSLVYIVDTITKQCYVGLSSVGGVTSVDCKTLTLRDEWKPVITWIKQAENSSNSEM